MQEMLGMEKNKKILTIVVITSIVIVALGTYMIFFNMTKPAFLGIVDNINDKGIDIVEKNIESLSNYDKDYVSNNKVKYYIEKESPNTQILENDFDLYVNKNSKNTHNIVKVTVNEEETKTYNIYEQNGNMFLDASEFNGFIQLNNENIPFVTANSNTINEMLNMYERAYENFKKQIDLADLYKITTKINNEKDKKTVHKFGISVDEKTLQQMVLNTLNDLKNDSKFVKSYISYQQAKNASSNLDNESVNQIIDMWIEEISKKISNQDIEYEIIITTSGIFNQNVLQIECMKLLYSTVLEKIDIVIDGDNILIKAEKNSETVLSSNIVLSQSGFDAKINTEKLNINIKANDFDVTKEMYITGDINEQKINSSYIMKHDKERQEILNDFELKIGSNEKNTVYIDVESNTKLISQAEYVNTKNIYNLSKLEQAMQEYFNQFKVDVIDKMGIEL